MPSDHEIPRAFGTSVSVSEFNPATYRWKQTAFYRDAQIRDLDRHGVLPGRMMQLQVAKDADEETGTFTDIDGDRAMLSMTMAGANVRIYGEGLSARGFVDPHENDPGERHYSEFRLVEWNQIPYSTVAKRDVERAENAALADKLTDREKELIVAMRRWALDRRDDPKPNAHWVHIPVGGSVQLPSGDETIEVANEDMKQLFKSQIGKLIMTTGERDEWQRGGKVTVASYHLLTAAEDIADSILGHREA